MRHYFPLIQESRRPSSRRLKVSKKAAGKPRRTNYSAGSSAVNGEQHGFSVAWKFITSTRVPSTGRYILNWYLPSGANLRRLVVAARLGGSRPPALYTRRAPMARRSRNGPARPASAATSSPEYPRPAHPTSCIRPNRARQEPAGSPTPFCRRARPTSKGQKAEQVAIELVLLPRDHAPACPRG